MKWVWLFSALAILCAAPASAQQIPAGTALPVMLNSSLDASKDKPGRTISARIMQQIQLPDGTKIPSGARIVGHILRVNSLSPASGSQLVLKFDQLNSRGQSTTLTTSLRAVANMTVVFEAQLPTSNFDEYGTTIADWTTVQVGGDAVYRGDGTVISPDNRVVGSATVGGDVTAKLTAVPDRGCRGSVEDNDRPQSLWVFSTSACGAYGFSDLRIAHAGRTDPLGEIALEAPANVRVRAGSGLLLRVIASSSLPAAPR
ncbi:MAG: hypothetical protein ACLPND_23415 [Candidatus Korobacteraceae bacterium]